MGSERDRCAKGVDKVKSAGRKRERKDEPQLSAEGKRATVEYASRQDTEPDGQKVRAIEVGRAA